MCPVDLILFAHDTHGIVDSTACSNFIQFDCEFFYRFVVRQTETAHSRPRHPPASRLFVVSFTCSIDLFEVKRKTHFLAFAKCAQRVCVVLWSSDQHWAEYFHDPRTDELLWIQWINLNFNEFCYQNLKATSQQQRWVFIWIFDLNFHEKSSCSSPWALGWNSTQIVYFYT